MIWVRLVAAAAVVLVAARTMWERRRGGGATDPRRGDRHWGDWPPDQMAP